MPRIVTVLLAAASLAAVSPASAFGTTITVSTAFDQSMPDGHCSLREAITAANTDVAPHQGVGECPAGSGTDTIVLPAGRYVLSILGIHEDANASGDLDISGPTVLRGVGAGVTTIDAAQIDRAIHVLAGGNVTIEDVTITGGRAPRGADGVDQTGVGSVSDGRGGAGRPGDAGGGILNDGTLSIADSEITHNAAGAGGRGGNGTGGKGASGAQTGDGGEGFGGDGGVGGPGGGVFSSGLALTLTRTIVSDDAAGAGGGGGNGSGGQGGFATTGRAGAGNIGTGGNGALGGTGGGIDQRGTGTVTIERSSISGNAAGTGGAGGLGTGGLGGGSDADLAAHGGGGFGGSGGPGGIGGGITADRVIAMDDTIDDNAAGSGGRAGDGQGELGGNDSGTNGVAGAGGRGEGGLGGLGGGAGGVDAGILTAVNDTITANAAGLGGAGGNGIGGRGGSILDSGTNGNGGDGSGGTGGEGGPGGGGWLPGGATLVHVTIASNGAGELGQPGEGQAGVAGTGGSGGTSGLSAPGVPGAPGVAGAILAQQPVTLQNSIVAGNSAPSCVNSFLDGGHNISFPDSSCPGAVIDPRLGPLADNGGPTETQALESGSAALDGVPAMGAGCAADDQRAVSRPQGGGCDIGAYESAPPGVSTGAVSGISAAAATLGGQINPNARPTSYQFEYGTTLSYGSSTFPQAAAPGATSAPVSGAVSGLAPSTTYHYRLVASNPDGTSFGADRTFTTAGGGVLGAGSASPRFLSASVRPRVFAVQRAGRAGRRGRQQPPIGTTFRYTLSEPARVLFTIERILPGRTVGRRCAAPTNANGTHRACRRLGKPRRFALGARAGQNATRFTGRIGGQALAPGRYRVTLLATNATGGQSAPKRLIFQVVPG